MVLLVLRRQPALSAGLPHSKHAYGKTDETSSKTRVIPLMADIRSSVSDKVNSCIRSNDSTKTVESAAAQMNSETSAQMRYSGNLEDQVAEKTASEIKRIIHGSVVTFEGTYQGKPIRVRIFCEPPQEPDPEIKVSD